MIRKLTLTAFKCFSDAVIPLAPFTLLAGPNGAGKSTVSQALLLIHQALREGAGARRSDLPLSGPLVSLGTVRDVVERERGGKQFRIGVAASGIDIQWAFGTTMPASDELSARLLRTEWRINREKRARGKELFPLALRTSRSGAALHNSLWGARYVPADRIGPEDAYPLYEAASHRSLGPRAEGAIGALYWGRDQDALRAVCHPSLPAPRVDRQVEAWLRDLFPMVRLDVQRVSNANLVTLAIATDEGGYHRAKNVGFGMTYAIPILVSLVSARPGDLVLIDSPEAHLHPRAQVAITQLAVRAANSGIQVIIETHSDHVLNAVRVALHRKTIDRNKISIQFFDRRNISQTPLQSVLVDKHGRFDHKPAGFFDEVDVQLSALLEPPHPDA